MDEHFLALAEAVGAEAGDNGYHRGLMGHAPFLLKATEASPPGYFFKFRRNGVMKQTPLAPVKDPQQAWHERLPADHAAAEIRCDVEDDYVFLWIDQPRELPVDSLAGLASACVRDHAGLFPSEAGCCMSCHQAGSASLVQANGSVAMLCPECLDQKRQGHAVANEKLNAADERFAFLIPLGLLAGSIGWALFWGAYDAVFKVAKVERIQVPVILLVVVAMCGFGLGWPTGKILHRAGASRQSSPLSLAVIFALAIAVGGELIYAAYTAFRITGGVDVELTRDLTLPFIMGDNPMYAATKIAFAITVGLGVSEAARLKEKKLAL